MVYLEPVWEFNKYLGKLSLCFNSMAKHANFVNQQDMKSIRIQHEITKVIVLLMPIFRTGKTVLHQGNEHTVSR